MENDSLIRVESEGRNTEEAIKAALRKLGVTRDRVHIEILAEGNKGLFNMNGSKQAKVRVTLKE